MAVFTAIGAVVGALGGAALGASAVAGAIGLSSTAAIIGGAVVGGLLGMKVDQKFKQAQAAQAEAAATGEQIAELQEEVTTLGTAQVGIQKDVIQKRSNKSNLLYEDNEDQL